MASGQTIHRLDRKGPETNLLRGKEKSFRRSRCTEVYLGMGDQKMKIDQFSKLKSV